MSARILRDEVASGRALIGPLLQEIPTSADLVEFLGAAGFDFVIVDGEHAGVSVEACREMVRAADAVGMPALVRVPTPDAPRVLAYLDTGVQGVVLSHCRSVELAEALVRAVKFPPRGIRGAAGGSRANLFGYRRPPREHVRAMNAETMCFGLIEDPDAVPVIREMLAIDGFDGCFLGAGDMALSTSLDLYGTLQTPPEIQSLIERVRDETLRAKKIVMAPAASGADAQKAIAQGARMVVMHFGGFLRAACAAYLSAARTNERT